MERVAVSPTVLLAKARATGFAVRADGDRLVVRGPKHLAALAERLLADKAGVLAALALSAEVAWREAVYRPQIPATGAIPHLWARPCAPGPEDCLSSGDRREAGQHFVCRACNEAERRVIGEHEAGMRAARAARGGTR